MIRLQSIINGWNRFFFQPESPLPIAVYRILLGLLVLANQALLYPEVEIWFSEEGILSSQTARNLPGGGGLSLFDYISTSNASVWYFFRELDFDRIKNLHEIGDTMSKAAAMIRSPAR